jgi:prepilin-type N-terminal cleavage/methylation domain-containing protein
MRRLTQLKNDRGFTMVEIMVIVAVIAILAGLSIPQYQKMVNKGNQQGAVVNLTSVYMAEKNFAAENHTYTTCLRAIGVQQVTGTQWYTVGIDGAGIPASCGQSGTQPCNTSAWDEGASVQTCVTASNSSDFTQASQVQNLSTAIPGVANIGTVATDMTASTFTARAAGSISSRSGYDRWSIDHTGNTQNYQPLF